MAGTWNAGRSGLVTAQNEPRALETLTTTGFWDLRSSGSAAWVTRMILTALVSDTFSASGPLRAGSDAGVVDQHVQVPLGVLDRLHRGRDRGVVGDIELHEPAPSSAAAFSPRSTLRAPMYTGWRGSVSWRAVS